MMLPLGNKPHNWTLCWTFHFFGGIKDLKYNQTNLCPIKRWPEVHVTVCFRVEHSFQEESAAW